MTDSTDMIPAEIEDAIRQILLHEWKVFVEPPHNEYDFIIPPIYQILVGSRSEQELSEFLYRTARDTFGVANDTTGHFELGRPIARRLLEIDV